MAGVGRWGLHLKEAQHPPNTRVGYRDSDEGSGVRRARIREAGSGGATGAPTWTVGLMGLGV